MNLEKDTAQRLQERFNIEPQITETLFSIGVIGETAARDFLIKDDYEMNLEMKYTYKKLKRIALADKYCCSVKTIEKVVY